MLPVPHLCLVPDHADAYFALPKKDSTDGDQRARCLESVSFEAHVVDACTHFLKAIQSPPKITVLLLQMIARCSLILPGETTLADEIKMPFSCIILGVEPLSEDEEGQRFSCSDAAAANAAGVPLLTLLLEEFKTSSVPNGPNP
ncbi:hypothetical protein ACLOJK_006730 [Asimina triloba]